MREWLLILHLAGPHADPLAHYTLAALILVLVAVIVSATLPALRQAKTVLVLISAALLALCLWPAANQLGARAQSSNLLSKQNSVLWADHMSVTTPGLVSAGVLSYSAAQSWLAHASAPELAREWRESRGSAPVSTVTFHPLQHNAAIIQLPPSVNADAGSAWISRLPARDQVTALNGNTASTWLDGQIEQSLSTTELYALILASILLVIVLGSPLLTLMALGGGVLATIYASALIVLVSIHMNISEYAVNIMDLLSLGLSIDYSVFLILRFRREYRLALDSLGDSEQAAAKADRLTKKSVLRAITLSATVLVTVMTGLLFLPRSLSHSLVLSAWLAVTCTYFTVRFVTLPVLRRWPGITAKWAFPWSLSDILDRVYHQLQRVLKVVPGVVLLLAMAAGLFALSRPDRPFHLVTPVSSLNLLPRHSDLRMALQETTPPPSRNFYDVVALDTPDSLSSVKTWDEISRVTRDLKQRWAPLQINSPTSAISPVDLARLVVQADEHHLAAIEGPAAPAVNLHAHTVLIGIQGKGSMARVPLIDQLRRVLPKGWQFGLSGGAEAYTATANTGLEHGLVGVLVFGILGTVIALRRLVGGWVAGLLAALFDMGILLVSLRIAQYWTGLTGSILLFPMIIVVVSLLMALSLDYEILLVHDVGTRVTRENIGTALAETGGTITGAGLIIAATFLTLMATTVPFLQVTGLIIGVSLFVDTIVVRSLLIPTALMAISDPWSARGKNVWRYADTLLGKVAVFGSMLMLAWLVFSAASQTAISPKPQPSWTITQSASPPLFYAVPQSALTPKSGNAEGLRR